MRNDIATARSWLFVPGDRPERFDKAVGSGADIVICDLEDAVGADAKDAARANVRAWLLDAGEAVVRVNPLQTQWFEADLAEIAGTPGLLGIMLPKAEDPSAIDALAAQLSGVPIVALLESARAIGEAQRIAEVAGVARLAFGSLDFALDIAADHDDPDALLLARSLMVHASRAAGAPAPLDGVTTALDDQELLQADAARAARLGFGGKLCIHPRQVAPVRAAFRPTELQAAWARSIIATYEAGSNGAIRSAGGELIDMPVLRRAQAIASVIAEQEYR